MTVSRVEVEQPSRRRSSRVVGLVVLVVATIVTAVAAYFWWHYRLDLFDDYRAGYNAVVPDPNLREGEDRGDLKGRGESEADTTPCQAAIKSAHPEVVAIWEAETWPDYLRAYDYGCASKRQNEDYDPWHLYRVFPRDQNATG